MASEALRGEIPVLARLSQGSERLRIVVTSQRLIMAHQGKRGAGAVTATTLLGSIGRGFEELIKGSKETVGRKKLEDLTPREILAAHRDNFSISYDEIVSVETTTLPDKTRIIVLSKNDKYEFFTGKKADFVTSLLGEILGPKFVLTK